MAGKRKVRIAAVAVVVTVLTAVSCSASDPAAEQAQQGTVGAVGGQVQLGGITVDVPAGAVADGTRFELRGDATGPNGIEGFGVGTQVFDIEVVAGSVNKPVTVRFPSQAPEVTTPPSVDGEVTALPVGLHRIDDGWEPIPATWDPVTGTVAVETPGFSPLGFTWLTKDAISRQATDMLDQFTSDLLADRGPAQCENEEGARADGWQVESTPGEVVKWCLGLEGESRVLRIVNNRRYPRIFTVRGASSVEAPSASLSSKFSKLLSEPNQFVVDPTGELAVTMAVPDGFRATISSEFDGFSMSLFALHLGVELSAAFLGGLGIKGVTPAKIAGNLEAGLCAASIVDAATDGEHFGAASIIKMRGCVEKAIAASVGQWFAVLSGPVALFFTTVAYLWGAGNGFVDILSGRDDYSITVGNEGAAPTRPGGPPGGIECGADPSNGEWVIVAHGITCAEVLRIADLYHTSPDIQGSSGQATVEGFSCSSDTFPTYEFNAYGACLDGEVGFFLYPNSSSAEGFQRTVNGSQVASRAAPTPDSELGPRRFESGESITVECQGLGDMVGGSDHSDDGLAIWFKMTDGWWISAAYVGYTPDPAPRNQGMDLHYDHEIPVCS